MQELYYLQLTWSHVMAAEPFSTLFISRLPLPGNNSFSFGHYRSKLFVVPYTTNPLVAAAGPLLSLLERLNITPSLPSIEKIHGNIIHELQAFYSQLNVTAYTEELDTIAHYLLSATIDELLGKNYLRIYGKAPEFKAFTPSSFDGIGPDLRFFDIIAYIKERPNQYLNLLELAYYCLITGFEGANHKTVDGRIVLDNLIEELYQIIQQYRVNKPLRLFEDKVTGKNEVKKSRNFWLGVGFIAVSCLTVGYFISHFLLKNQVEQIQLAAISMVNPDSLNG